MLQMYKTHWFDNIYTLFNVILLRVIKIMQYFHFNSLEQAHLSKPAYSLMHLVCIVSPPRRIIPIKNFCPIDSLASLNLYAMPATNKHYTADNKYILW